MPNRRTAPRRSLPRHLVVASAALAFAAGCATSEPSGAVLAQTEAGAETGAEAGAEAGAGDETVRCREVLRGLSNVLETVCMTEADWELYKRERRADARELVRSLQGGYAGF